jgi:hypothetical protein
MKLKSMIFDGSAALFAEVDQMLGDISITEWLKAFNEWKARLKGYIDAERECL